MNRVQDKPIEIQGRQFLLCVPGPWDGCAIFDMTVQFTLPFVPEATLGLKTVRRPMPPDQLKAFMSLCLSNCAEVIQGNKIPVIDDTGNPGINNFTGPLAAALTSQYILFFVDYWTGGKKLTSNPPEPDTTP